jgi:hypothetical protein
MSTLTIEVDDDLYARARQLAAARKMTVAEMLERLLRVAADRPPAKSELPPITRQVVGLLPSMTDEEAERVLEEERTRKFGKP